MGVVMAEAAAKPQTVRGKCLDRRKGVIEEMLRESVQKKVRIR